MLMLKRVVVCLCSLVIFALLVSVNIASGIDVAICTVSYPWRLAKMIWMLWQIGLRVIPAARRTHSY